MPSPHRAVARPALLARALSLVALATLALSTLPALAQDASADPMATPAASAQPSPAPIEGAVTLYTSVTQDTIDAVLAAFAEQHPDVPVEVFRAPTGELDARIAAELRSGGLGADVLWVSDPLSLQRYEAAGLLAPLTGDAVEAVPEAYRTTTSVGTRLLNLVIVAGADQETTPTDWADLHDPTYSGGVAIPDPGFAGSAFAALGYFAAQADLGMDFFQQLKDNGAVQVASPVDVMTGVAEGVYQVGISLDKIVNDAIADGSPIQLVWPTSGAIAVYSPAAVVDGSPDADAARSFLDFLVSSEGQAAIAASGWQPVLPGTEWVAQGSAVSPDWPTLFGTQAELLEAYRAIFGD